MNNQRTANFPREHRIWLCGITQDRKEDIDEMTKDAHEYFDGLIFVDGYSTDGTFELLNERKGDGHIIQRKWTNDHDFQMNEFLRQGPMQNRDWFVTLDSPDRITDYWGKRLREEIKTLQEEKIGAIQMAGKIYLAQYFDHMFYFQTPHWGLNGIVNGIKNYTEEEKKNYVTSKRFDDPVKSALLHPVKYFYVYGRSNHSNLLYQKYGPQILQAHESNRLQFRLYCQKNLGLELTLDSLAEYMKVSLENKDFDDFFLETVELEVNLKDIFRYKVLKQPFEEIIENRFDWSIKEYLESGNLQQTYTEYKGVITEYEEELQKQIQK